MSEGDVNVWGLRTFITVRKIISHYMGIWAFMSSIRR